MLYVIDGHKKDMYFVCQDTTDEGGFEIVRVFYSEKKADLYIKDSLKNIGVYDD